MSSSSSPTSSAGGDAPGPDSERGARPLLVDRIAELERQKERLEASNAELERENERLERCLRRRRRERQDVIDRYERQLRERTAALERERTEGASASRDRGRVATVALAVARWVVERCPGLGRS